MLVFFKEVKPLHKLFSPVGHTSTTLLLVCSFTFDNEMHCCLTTISTLYKCSWKQGAGTTQSVRQHLWRQRASQRFVSWPWFRTECKSIKRWGRNWQKLGKVLGQKDLHFTFTVAAWPTDFLQHLAFLFPFTASTVSCISRYMQVLTVFYQIIAGSSGVFQKTGHVCIQSFLFSILVILDRIAEWMIHCVKTHGGANWLCLFLFL